MIYFELLGRNIRNKFHVLPMYLTLIFSHAPASLLSCASQLPSSPYCGRNVEKSFKDNLSSMNQASFSCFYTLFLRMFSGYFILQESSKNQEMAVRVVEIVRVRATVHAGNISVETTVHLRKYLQLVVTFSFHKGRVILRNQNLFHMCG